MKIVGFSMTRPVTVTMVTIAALLFGWVSLWRLPWNLLPDISYPSLTLRTEYPDAAPAEIENLVTEPLEQSVAVVQGLRHLRSVSRSGVSEITLEFAWNTDMDYAALDVREKIDLINLPDGIQPPVLLRYDPNLDPVLRLGLHGDKDLVTLRYLADRIVKKELESIDGVASARIKGGLEEEIQVQVDEGKLALLGIPISAVNNFLASQNINASGGSLRDRDAEFLVRTLNEFADADEIGRTVLIEQEGRRVTLADVSEIHRGYKDRDVITRVHGEEAVEIALFKEGDANTVEVARRVKAKLKRLEETLPKGVGTEILFDQSTFIESAVDEVKANAIQGGLLAVIVLYLFLKDRRSTLITATTIPISIVATFLVMQQLGVTLNIMSLGGLALGVGNMMDNAIVVLEAIARHRAQGKGVWQATLDGTNEVAVPVTGSTATTVAVFLPIIFVEGIAGQIFRDQAITITAAQIISLLMALTIIPIMAALGHLRNDQAIPGDPSPAIDPASPVQVRPSKPTHRLTPVLRPAGIGFRWVGRFVSVLLPGALIRIVTVGGA
ncbi:MAG: efflux RND transporter permease subunit [Candidatus Eisenbacteria bacterium]|nr:efflux RND transporter permease subunit [Candidatus Eisenbacteria bacterium]